LLSSFERNVQKQAETLVASGSLGSRDKMMDRHAVVTGIGLLTSIGHTLQSFTAALRGGMSGFRSIPYFDTTGYPCNRGAVITDFPEDFLSFASARPSWETAEIYGAFCAMKAIEDAGLGVDQLDPFSTGVVVASSNAGVETNQRYAEDKLSGRLVFGSTVARTPGNVTSAIRTELKLRGPQAAVSTACAAGSNSVGLACDLLQAGRADVMIAGGAEPFSKLSYSGFTLLKSLTRGALRPFDETRDGTGLGEAACIFVIESEDRARARGADIYGEICGYGLSDDAYHATAPDPTGEGAALAIEQCLLDAHLEASDVDYINAHGTGTRYNDMMELTALTGVFGDAITGIPISSTKPLHGHTLSCAGSIELLVCMAALREGFIPGNVNTTKVISEFSNLDIPQVAVERPGMQVAVSNSFGFGGNNTCIAVRATGTGIG
jgi:3-oxoacyl-[acyl-carrier-protein] synthase II